MYIYVISIMQRAQKLFRTFHQCTYNNLIHNIYIYIIYIYYVLYILSIILYIIYNILYIIYIICYIYIIERKIEKEQRKTEREHYGQTNRSLSQTLTFLLHILFFYITKQSIFRVQFPLLESSFSFKKKSEKFSPFFSLVVAAIGNFQPRSRGILSLICQTSKRSLFGPSLTISSISETNICVLTAFLL